jgi:hypothetical protein
MILTVLYGLVNWMDLIVPGVVLLLALIAYVQRSKVSLRHWSRVLILAMVIYYPLYALIESIAQYEVWSTSGSILSRTLANQPLSPVMKGLTLWYDLPFMHTGLGYTIFYSWGRFWLGAVLAISAAALFWFLLKLLQKYKSRFFEDGEVELGALTALLVGWPGFVVFIPLVFISVVIVSIFRLIFFKEAYTTLGAPMLFATILFFIWGQQLLTITGFTVLKA